MFLSFPVFFLVCLFCFPFFLNRLRKCLQRGCIQFKLRTVLALTVISACEILRSFDACSCVKSFAGGVGATYNILCGDFKNLHKFFDNLLLIGGMYSHFPRILSGFSASFLTVEFSRYDLPFLRLGHRKGRGIHCVSWDVFLWRTELVCSQLFWFEMAMPWRNPNYWQRYHITGVWACDYYMLLSMWGDDKGRPNDYNGLQWTTPQNPLAEPFPSSQPRQTVNDNKMIDIALIHWFGANYLKNRAFPGGASDKISK